MSLTGHSGHFLDALAFLSRLAPPRKATVSSLATCASWLAPVGLVLGFLFTLVSGLVFTGIASLPHLAGHTPLFALSAAWVWLCLEIWTTRGLHWDGLADLTDACGSGACGERFWEIMRDSRLGAFGALGLLLVFCGQWIVIALHLASGQLAHLLVLVLAPAWGRACAVWLAACAPAYNPASLGGMLAAGATRAVSRAHWLTAILCLAALCALGLNILQAALLLTCQWWLIRYLAGIAKSRGGVSGDFLGAAIELGQLWFLLASL